MTQYRFNKDHHIHQILQEGSDVWKDLTGTSTVGSVLSKPLTYWACGLTLECLGWLNPKEHSEEERKAIAERFLSEKRGITAEDYLSLCDNAYHAHTRKLKDSAKSGTDRHALIEEWVKSVMAGKEIKPHEDILPFVNWARENVKTFLWSEAHCFSESLWVGGISDIGVELNSGLTGIIDIKSSKEAYPNQFFQIAGYDLQISENGGFTATGERIFNPPEIQFHAVFPFGAKNPKMEIDYETKENKEAFKAELILYRKINRIK